METTVDDSAAVAGGGKFLDRHRWVVFVLPLAVYMAVGSLEPVRPAPKAKPPEEMAAMAEGGGAAAEQAVPEEIPTASKLGIPFTWYPLVYTVKIALTVAAMLLVLPGYRWFPCRVSPLAILAGAAGIIVWIGFIQLGLEAKWLEPLGMGSVLDLGARPGFDPFRALREQPEWVQWAFLAVRLFGLVVVVAIVEEFFLRGFLMRFPIQADWWEVPIGRLSVASVLICVLYAGLSHPAEMFAAVAWFLLITLLAVKTKNIWDCVAAHATTNLLLGAYIVALRQWQYW